MARRSDPDRVGDAVEDGVGEAGITDAPVPLGDRELRQAGDQCRAVVVVAVFDDLKECVALGVRTSVVISLFGSANEKNALGGNPA